MEYVKRYAGEDIARQLFNEGCDFTFNHFELRTAALLLLSGTPMEEVTRLSVEDDLFSLEKRDSGSFPKPMDGVSPPLIGRVSFVNGDHAEYYDALQYVSVVNEELPYHLTTGFEYETLTDNPFVRKAVDDILYGLFCEQNSVLWNQSLFSLRTPLNGVPSCLSSMNFPVSALRFTHC